MICHRVPKIESKRERDREKKATLICCVPFKYEVRFHNDAFEAVHNIHTLV